ncbi:MAG: hypothetical protein FWD61_19870, partial [Phycisphaerales bacterium]|nr:hypothetical protein [Phycisphaerales bacterium]
ASTLKFGITICVNHRFFPYILNIAIPSFSVDAALGEGIAGMTECRPNPEFSQFVACRIFGSEFHEADLIVAAEKAVTVASVRIVRLQVLFSGKRRIGRRVL